MIFTSHLWHYLVDQMSISLIWERIRVAIVSLTIGNYVLQLLLALLKGNRSEILGVDRQLAVHYTRQVRVDGARMKVLSFIYWQLVVLPTWQLCHNTTCKLLGIHLRRWVPQALFAVLIWLVHKHVQHATTEWWVFPQNLTWCQFHQMHFQIHLAFLRLY